MAVHNDDETGKKELTKRLDGRLNGATEAVQIESDRMLHYTLVRMSRNRLVIANYVALDRVINRYIRDVRKKIRDQGSEEFKEFQDVHRKLVQAVLDGNLEMGKQALDKHFVYLRNDYDT